MMKQPCCIIVSRNCVYSNPLVFDHLNSALKMYCDMPVLASRSGTKVKACSVLEHLAIMFAQSHSRFIPCGGHHAGNRLAYKCMPLSPACTTAAHRKCSIL